LKTTFNDNSNGVKINIQLSDRVGKINKGNLYNTKTCFLKKWIVLDRTFVHGTLGMLLSCVRLSVRLSVTSRYCSKPAKHKITQTTSFDSPGSLVFCCQSCRQNSI